MDLVDEKFWSKVEVAASCWNWTACKNAGGYGKLGRKGKSFLAHRYAYQMLVGAIPDGLHLDHLCRNRQCVNPDHLDPVTNQENQRRGFNPSMVQSRATHCKSGHEYAVSGFYQERGVHGARRCRKCEELRREARRG